MGLASPSQLLDAPEIALVNALITVGLIILITFPSQLFNRTYEENYERIHAWWSHRFPWIARLRSRETRGTAARRGAVTFAAVVMAGGSSHPCWIRPSAPTSGPSPCLTEPCSRL